MEAVNRRETPAANLLASAVVNPYVIAGGFAVIAVPLLLRGNLNLFATVAVAALVAGWSSAWSP
jgi:hypothetical protein